MQVEVRKPTEEEKQAAQNWGIWQKEASEFGWEYSQKETCLILEGKAKVITEDGKEYIFGTGDWVVFPQGLKCKWKIIEKIKKRYKLG